MKALSPLLVLAAACAVGCSHLDLVSLSSADRVLTGTVDFPEATQPDQAPVPPPDLPPDAVLVVQVVDPHPAQAAPPMATASAAASASASTEPPPLVLGEQTIRNLGAPPFAYRIEYSAEDDALQHGLQIEARISYGGQLRYSNTESFSVGLSDVGEPHRVVVAAVAP